VSDSPLYHYLNDLPANLPPLAIALGVFDGVHRGHQALLAAARQATEGAPAALTFTPHPAAVFAPTAAPKLLGTLEERVSLLRQQGAEHVIVARFDTAFASLNPEAFITSILLERLQSRTVIVGDDFRFGRDRAGDCETLRAGGEQQGFSVQIIPPVMVNGEVARSSGIRRHIAAGEVEDTTRLLGRPYTLTGTVVQGRQLGRTLGFPTANLASAPEVLVPGAGVYAGRATLANGAVYRAAISVGTNPTVTDGPDAPRTVEAYLMDGFSGDLYGQAITFTFDRFLRPMLKFDGLPALIDQMTRDVDEVNKISL
jgi:riboflavin kinase/FMN adenylyltransferase